ncbi:MAG: hypothetical protein K8S98_00140 [Planctomycetes bacterium]|nr:hypothetical protein [Planctomycetota bacterium]
MDGTGADFTDLQPAIDAAADGDTVIVLPGTGYGSFVIDGKSLNVVGRFPFIDKPRVKGTGLVKNLQGGQRVVIECLKIDAIQSVGPALTLFNNDGSIRLEGTDVVGSFGTAVAAPGAGIVFVGCDDVALNDCFLEGGYGMTVGQDGAPGAMVTGGSAVVFHDGAAVGGRGGDALAGSGLAGGKGGAGVALASAKLFASKVDFLGGDGGTGADELGDCTQGGVAPGNGGDGGNGVYIEPFPFGHFVRLIASKTNAGDGGAAGLGLACSAVVGQNGQDISPSAPPFLIVEPDLPHTALRGAGFALSNGATIDFWVQGEPGANATLFISASSSFFDAGPLRGIELLGFVKLRVMPLGILPASGAKFVSLPAASLLAGSDALTLHLQALVAGSRLTRWTSVSTVISLAPGI